MDDPRQRRVVRHMRQHPRMIGAEQIYAAHQQDDARIARFRASRSAFAFAEVIGNAMRYSVYMALLYLYYWDRDFARPTAHASR